MSIKQYPGGIITKNPAAPTTGSAKGIWTLSQAADYTKQGIWPRTPGIPTIGTATIVGTTATITFTAPSELGTGTLTYIATSSPGSVTGSSATSPITVSGLTGGTSYTFTVTASTPGGTSLPSAASNSVTAITTGQQEYTSAGTYTWVAPALVTSVSVVAIGGGSNGGGGLGYKNNYSVTPGSSYTVGVDFPL